MSTYGDILTQIKAFLGRDSTETETKALIAVNSVQRLLAAAGSWEDLERVKESLTLTSGTEEYDLRTLVSDTAFMKVLSFQLYDDDRWYEPMRQVTPQRWDERIEVITHSTQDKPYTFKVFQRKVTFYPTPDDDYTLKCRYYVKPTVITSESDNLAFDDMYDPLIAHAATGFVWMYLEEMDLAKAFMGMADGLLEEFKAFNDKLFNFSALVSAKHNEHPRYADPWSDPFVKQLDRSR